MKKIIFLLVLLISAVNAATYQCPQSVQCMYSNGHTACDNLPNTWEVYQELPAMITIKSTYHPTTMSWESDSEDFRNVKCTMVSELSQTNYFIVDRSENASILYPDVSDFWGWRWAANDKSIANCNAPNVCQLLDFPSYSLVDTGGLQTLSGKTLVSPVLTGSLLDNTAVPKNYVDSADSILSTRISNLNNSSEKVANKGIADGYASLDSNGKVPSAQLPSIPSAQVQSNWTQTDNTQINFIQNKPTLGTASSQDSSAFATASQGAKADTAVQPSSLSSYATTSALTAGLATKFNTPSGTTLQYIRGDGTLNAFPSIPASQINSDWNSSSGVSQILNKPTLATVATTGSYNDLSNKPSLFNGQFSSLTGIPTTLSGYGITDAYPLIGNPSNFLTSITSLQVTTALGFTPYNASNPNSYITSSGARSSISLTTTGSAGAATYNSSTGVINIPVYVSSSPTINNAVVRSLNSNFTVSATRSCNVTYTVRIAYSVTTLLGSTGAIDLQYSIDGGSNWITIATISNNISLGVVLSGYNDYELHGDNIPANALVRLNSTSTNTTNTYRTGREVLL